MTTLPTAKVGNTTRNLMAGTSEGQVLHNMNVRANALRRRGLSAAAGRVVNPRVLRRTTSVVA